MDRSLTKIVQLLSADDRTLQQAAAHVLGALGSDDAAVLQALAGSLASPDNEIRVASLTALETDPQMVRSSLAFQAILAVG